MATFEQLESVPEPVLIIFNNEMRKREIDLSSYVLDFYENDSFYLVCMIYKNRPPRLRGCVEGFPEFDVKIAKVDNSVESVTGNR